MSKKRQSLHPDDPLLHPDHPRPRTRREFLRQGLMTGGAVVTGSSLLNLVLPQEVLAVVDPNLTNPAINDIGSNCISGAGARVPFICFDLAGGANFASSNVLVGQQGGQTARMDAAAYRMHGLPADRIPDGTATGFTNSELGLLFHSESALLAGILNKLAVAGRANVNGAVIPARSENDTGNNPHNPLYAIARTGALGQAATLIGSVNSDSGGNSLAPSAMPFAIDPSIRPVKVDRPTDVTGLVGTGDTGGVASVLTLPDAVRVMESAARITNSKLPNIDTLLGGATDTQIKQLIRCGYVKSAYLADAFGDINAVDPTRDADIVGATGIFSTAEFNGDAEFRKTASVMKMVINRMSGAGCITMGGYDYHTGDRIAGERRDLRAGKCIGACLEYARRKNMPLMIYVFSDGSVFSNGTLDSTVLTDNGSGTVITVPAGKGVWTGDSSTTASSFFLIYSPAGRPQLINAARQQLGWFRANGGVETASSPGANNVNQLVEMVALNYLALHNTNGINTFASTFPGHHLGASYDQWAAFQPIV